MVFIDTDSILPRSRSRSQVGGEIYNPDGTKRIAQVLSHLRRAHPHRLHRPIARNEAAITPKQLLPQQPDPTRPVPCSRSPVRAVCKRPNLVEIRNSSDATVFAIAVVFFLVVFISGAPRPWTFLTNSSKITRHGPLRAEASDHAARKDHAVLRFITGSASCSLGSTSPDLRPRVRANLGIVAFTRVRRQHCRASSNRSSCGWAPVGAGSVDILGLRSTVSQAIGATALLPQQWQFHRVPLNHILANLQRLLLENSCSPQTVSGLQTSKADYAIPPAILTKARRW